MGKDVSVSPSGHAGSPRKACHQMTITSRVHGRNAPRGRPSIRLMPRGTGLRRQSHTRPVRDRPCLQIPRHEGPSLPGTGIGWGTSASPPVRDRLIHPRTGQRPMLPNPKDANTPSLRSVWFRASQLAEDKHARDSRPHLARKKRGCLQEGSPLFMYS